MPPLDPTQEPIGLLLPLLALLFRFFAGSSCFGIQRVNRAIRIFRLVALGDFNGLSGGGFDGLWAEFEEVGEGKYREKEICEIVGWEGGARRFKLETGDEALSGLVFTDLEHSMAEE